MEIINKTPHPITLCKSDGSIIKIFEPDGDPIRVKVNGYWFNRDAFLKRIQKKKTKKFMMVGVKGINRQLIKLYYSGFPNPKKFIIKKKKKNNLKFINEPEQKENVVYVVSANVIAFSSRQDYAAMCMYDGKHDSTCPFTGLILQHE